MNISAESYSFEEIPKNCVNRAAYLKQLIFPEDNDKMVIIPSNEKGTGFIMSCYKPEFLD